jgi:hypothetical protein
VPVISGGIGVAPTVPGWSYSVQDFLAGVQPSTNCADQIGIHPYGYPDHTEVAAVVQQARTAGLPLAVTEYGYRVNDVGSRWQGLGDYYFDYRYFTAQPDIRLILLTTLFESGTGYGVCAAPGQPRFAASYLQQNLAPQLPAASC